jgi:hypothetical protein
VPSQSPESQATRTILHPRPKGRLNLAFEARPFFVRLQHNESCTAVFLYTELFNADAFVEHFAPFIVFMIGLFWYKKKMAMENGGGNNDTRILSIEFFIQQNFI